MMGGSGCITCHGGDGQGGTVNVMMSQFDVPDIRWSTLSQAMQSPEGGMEPPYDPTTFARAVRDGVGSDGGSLEAPMPQWQLTDRQVNALIAYLGTL
jgi:mono/diheme cytochrome c family protein